MNLILWQEVGTFTTIYVSSELSRQFFRIHFCFTKEHCSKSQLFLFTGQPKTVPKGDFDGKFPIWVELQGCYIQINLLFWLQSVFVLSIINAKSNHLLIKLQPKLLRLLAQCYLLLQRGELRKDFSQLSMEGVLLGA